MTLTAKLHHDHRSYHVEFDGEIVVVGSRDPEFDLARVLRDRGLTGSVIIVDGKTGRHRSTVTDIEKAAGLCTIELAHGPRIVKHRPKSFEQTCLDRSPAGEDEEAA